MIVEIKPAKATKKEYAEQPFTINALIGSQFTIEEKLGMSECPRIKHVPTRDQKKTYDVVALRVNNGTFIKDLHIFDSDWKMLCTALPDSLISLEGVVLKPIRDQNNPLKIKFEYVGVHPVGFDASVQTKSEKVAASMEEAPTEIGNQIRALHAAMQTNQATNIFNSAKRTIEIAEKTRPGDALNLISAAKQQGWIREVTQDGVTGYKAE